MSLAVVFFTVLAAFGLAGITHAGATTATSGESKPAAKLGNTTSGAKGPLYGSPGTSY